MTFVSCEEQKNNDNNMNKSKSAPYNREYIGDGLTYNYDTLSPDLIQHARRILDNYKFKFPDSTKFSQRIKKVYGWDIQSYLNPVIVLRRNMFPEIAIKTDRFILFQTPDSDKKFEIEDENLFYYNQYIFNNDRSAFNLLKIKDPYLLKDLVISYGYSEDKELVKFVFDSFDFTSTPAFHDLIFDLNEQSQKYTLRKNIVDDIENIIFKGMTQDLSYAKEGNAYNRVPFIIRQIENNKNNYTQPDETIAYLYEKELRIGVTGNIQEKLNRNDGYKEFLDKNEYFNYNRLKDYVQDIYQPVKENAYFVQDTDGYTNLRKEKNSSSEIIQKVKSGENIEVLDQNGEWYRVATKEGNRGYIHKSRIKSY